MSTSWFFRVFLANLCSSLMVEVSISCSSLGASGSPADLKVFRAKCWISLFENYLCCPQRHQRHDSATLVFWEVKRQAKQVISMVSTGIWRRYWRFSAPKSHLDHGRPTSDREFFIASRGWVNVPMFLDMGGPKISQPFVTFFLGSHECNDPQVSWFVETSIQTFIWGSRNVVKRTTFNGRKSSRFSWLWNWNQIIYTSWSIHLFHVTVPLCSTFDTIQV